MNLRACLWVSVHMLDFNIMGEGHVTEDLKTIKIHVGWKEKGLAKVRF